MDRRTTDSEWPIGYPFVASRDFTLPAPIPNVIAMRSGDHGKVTSKANTNGNICVQYPQDVSGNPGREGWVPRDDIRIGTSARIGEPILIQIDQNASAGRSGKTVCGLLSAWYEGRGDLPTEPEVITDLLKSESDIRQQTNKIVVGVGKVSSGLQQCLDRQDFTLWQLKGSAPDGEHDQHVGIYVIVHWDFIGQPEREPEPYAGSTARSFESRYGEHVDASKDPEKKGVHYNAARLARKHCIFPISYLNVDDAESPEVKLAEQVFMSLLQTTCKEVLNFKADGFTGETEEQDNKIGAPDSVSRVSKYYVQKADAVVLRKLADQVFERTGWPGGCDRSTGKKAFGSSAGLNWTSPLTGLRKARTIWTKTSIPGQFANFRRTDLVTRVATGGAGVPSLQVYLKHHTPTNTAWIALLRRDKPWPPENSKIHVVLELRLDGKPHTAGLARAPGVGALSDWANANQLGMRIEWQRDDGVWVQRQFQLRDDNEKLAYAPNGMTQNYNIANGLRGYVLQEQRTLSTEQQEWIWDFGIARVKEVYLDHLDQTIRVRDLPGSRVVPGPTFKTMQQIGQELVDLGAGRYARPSDTQYPIFPDGQQRSAGRSRKSCNACYANTVLGRSNTMCVEVPGQNTCERCQRYGRPCTFAHTRDLENNPALLRALTNPNEVPFTITSVDGNDKMERFRA
ncbi:uncharacterized protein LTR77_006642 [Saxophila tyrrhenica]|uniref:Uncharacterized protein n=1 Tax=Saxophila tyrrhenica TaxID=1690608 RepID=A0AAV9P5D1_9PEZI|nr:hypothetical protein LTR77_006642 [Saxophila tyrrhenica]